MKRYGNLWSQVVTFENLLCAFNKARKGKRQRHEVAQFSLNLERELLNLQRELLSGKYMPGDYRQFTLYERKPRLISAAPFRDRVVHHALMNIVEPLLDKTGHHMNRVLRGGSWNNKPRNMRSANRNRNNPTNRNNNNGFRVASPSHFRSCIIYG